MLNGSRGRAERRAHPSASEECLEAFNPLDLGTRRQHHHNDSHSVPTARVISVSGAPTLKYSQKLIDTPLAAAF